ncbi:hypothetical protein SAMN05216276_1034107, partial [Streptosporangium subroseum]
RLPLGADLTVTVQRWPPSALRPATFVYRERDG